MSRENDCSICYETFAGSDLEGGGASPPVNSMKGRLEVEGCDHVFCRECLTDHCKHAISAREIPIRCPASGSDNCQNFLRKVQVKSLLCGNDENDVEGSPASYGSFDESDDSTVKNEPPLDTISYWTQFQRFLRKLNDPTLLSCTSCDELFSRQEDGLVQGHPNDVACPSCGHKFCAVHGDAHLSQSCGDYKPAREELQSEKAIRRFTKPCSHCGIAIHKESGCDHIVCGSCKLDMCFKCGSHEFLTGEMLRSCKKCEQSYIDHRYIWRYRMTLCLSLPLYIPVCIFHIAVMIVLVVATGGCFCCLGCGVKVISEDANEDGPPSPGTGKTIFRPILGMRTVIAMVLLPVIDLTNQCGMSCCCGLDLPGIEGTGTSSDSINDELDDDGSAALNA